MGTDNSQLSDTKSELAKVLSDPKLLDAPRAFLLLKICQMAQLLRPDILQQYWKPLRAISQHLPSQYREAYEGLRAAIEPSTKANLGKFAQGIVDEIDAAVKKSGSNKKEAIGILNDCKTRLLKRWWAFGKQPAWTALVQGWAQVDRAETLMLMGRVPTGVQQGILAKFNESSPLTPEEWETADQHSRSSGGVTPVIVGMLDRDKVKLLLTATMAETVGKSLLSEMQAVPLTEELSHKVEIQREKARERYFKLVTSLNELSSDIAESLMESLFTVTATTNVFNEKWPDRFTSIRQLISYWVGLPACRGKALDFLIEKSPKHLRDFCVSEWRAFIASSQQDSLDSWQWLEKNCDDKISSQSWFAVSLVRRGMGDIALSLARSSPSSTDLLPRIRRAWLLCNPETASSVMTLQELEGDLVGQFLFKTSAAERVNFLRQCTQNGSRSLPDALWKQPEIMALVGKNSNQDALLSLYTKSEPLESQFKDYLRLHGFGQYNYADIDPYLLAAFVAWDTEHPDEVSSVLTRMWTSMKPPSTTLRFDLLRNSIFERCQTVFAARPSSLNELFVKWVKQELVDKTVREQVGQTIYSFSLKDIAPFLNCLLSAQKVAKLSAARCDEILTCAIKNYTASDDLMTAAGELYASDKGLSAVQPHVSLRDGNRLVAWQLGVIQASLTKIMTSVLTQPAFESHGT